MPEKESKPRGTGKKRKEVKEEKEEKKVEKPEKKEAKPKEKELKGKEEKEEKGAKPGKKAKKVVEEIHTINLRKAYEKPNTRRARVAIALIRDYVLKQKRREVVISPELNSVIWERSISKPPRKIKIKLEISDDKIIANPV